MFDAVAAAVSQRYRVEREIGRGANAVVYLARDLRHDRLVALKVLLPELAQTVRAERFLREIQIAAKLTHPHILPLYDSGEIEGALYYVMPYVEGESLRARLLRERQLPLDQALHVARDVASALAYAHTHGVVHRDIKPENILLQEGMAVVADFGIARALAEAGAQNVTQIGIVVGTPAYMSPEQAAGSGQVDARSDIYAVGCVLYEMLAGHPPFTGESSQEVLARHTLDRAPALGAARPGLPGWVENTIQKALAKSPVDRFSSASEFAAALTPRTIISEMDSVTHHAIEAGPNSTAALPVRTWPRARRAGVAAAILGTILGIAILAKRSQGNVRDIRAVAVLPFTNMSGGQDGEYFSDGVSEELINVLAQVDSLRVAARTSSFAFKNTHLSIRSIADSLNVGAIVEGSVQRENNRLRITARLIDASTGYELWSERVETESSNVLAAQDSIVHSIADALRLKLSAPAQARIAARKPVNPEAYDLYSRGQYFLARRTLADFNRAISHFEQAVRVDSQYAVAYAGLADAYLLKGNYDAKGRELSRARQKAAALKAMQLDSMLPEAHRALCRVFDNEYDNVAAERECRRAIELNPADVMAHNWLHFPLGYLGRHEEAIREARIAQSLDPASVGVAEGLAQAYTTAGRYDEAIQQYRRVLELQPEQPSSRNDLAKLYWAKGMFEQARALIEPPARAGNRLPQAILARIHMSSGDTAAARRILNELKNLPESELPDIVRPIMFIALNQPDEALETLERSVRERTLYRLRFYDVMLKELWQDPRFLQLKREAHVR